MCDAASEMVCKVGMVCSILLLWAGLNTVCEDRFEAIEVFSFAVESSH